MASSTPELRIEPLANQVSLTDRVTEALSQMIRSGEYPPRTRLPTETEMGSRFGVSRTVIREAVSRLKSEGLVESRQGVGVFVRDRSLDTPFRIDPNVVESMRSIMHIVELRRGIEAEMAALAAERRSPEQLEAIRSRLDAVNAAEPVGGDGVDADMAFHREIARATGNPHFVALWDFVGQFLRGAMTVTRANEARKHDLLAQSNSEHRAILEAIVRQDSEGARAAARHHMDMAVTRIRAADPDFWRTEEARSVRRIGAVQLANGPK